MVVTELPYELVSDDYSEASGMRSPGLHLSTIIQDLNKIRGKTYKEVDDATKQVYFSFGFIWETIVSYIIRETAIRRSNGVLIRPGEINVDGIAMSPDAVDVTDMALEEYKATWLSARNGIDSPKIWDWIIQLKCYCYALGVLKARLRVWFIAGDWKGSGPIVKCWQLEFSQAEVEEAFQMCKNHAIEKGYLPRAT